MILFPSILFFISSFGILYSTFIAQPYIRYIPPGIPSLSHPFKSDSLPFPLLLFVSLILPHLCLLWYYKYKYISSHSAAIFAVHLFAAQCFTICVVENLKNIVSRPRPDFYAREQIYKKDKEGSTEIYQDGFKSMPSGHTAAAFSLFSSVLFIVSAIKIRSKLRWIGVILLFGAGMMVGLSRIYDNRHFITDVVAGAFISMICTLIVCMPGYKLLRSDE